MLSQQIVSATSSSLVDASRSVRVLLIGAGNVGKTTMAFGLAYEDAENGGTPLFICNQSKLETKLPLHVLTGAGDGGTVARMAPEVLSRISMKYVTSMNELKAVIAGLHACTPPPSMIIIDDLTLIVDPLHSVQRSDPKFLEICMTLGAFLDDADTFLSVQHHAGPDISSSSATSSAAPRLRVVITDSCEEGAYLSVMQRYVPHILSLRKATDGADEVVSLVLQQGAYSRQQAAVVLRRIEPHQSGLLVQL